MSLRRSLKRIQPGPAVIVLDHANLTENSAPGTVIGRLSVPTNFAPYTFALTGNASNKVALSGSDLTAGATNTDYETDTSLTVTVTATPDDGGAVLTQDLVITVIDVTNTFNVLTLGTPTVVNGAAEDTVVGAVSGKTTGSTLTMSVNDGGRFKLTGTNVVVGPTAIAAASGPRSVTLHEVKADYTTRDTVLSIAVT